MISLNSTQLKISKKNKNDESGVAEPLFLCLLFLLNAVCKVTEKVRFFTSSYYFTFSQLYFGISTDRYQAEIKGFSKRFQRSNKHTTALQGFKIVYCY